MKQKEERGRRREVRKRDVTDFHKVGITETLKTRARNGCTPRENCK
jgi:hypothetical protein